MSEHSIGNKCESELTKTEDLAKTPKVIVVGGSGRSSFGAIEKMYQKPKDIFTIIEYQPKDES